MERESDLWEKHGLSSRVRLGPPRSFGEPGSITPKDALEDFLKKKKIDLESRITYTASSDGLHHVQLKVKGITFHGKSDMGKEMAIQAACEVTLRSLEGILTHSEESMVGWLFPNERPMKIPPGCNYTPEELTEIRSCTITLKKFKEDLEKGFDRRDAALKPGDQETPIPSGGMREAHISLNGGESHELEKMAGATGVQHMTEPGLRDHQEGNPGGTTAFADENTRDVAVRRGEGAGGRVTDWSQVMQEIVTKWEIKVDVNEPEVVQSVKKQLTELAIEMNRMCSSDVIDKVILPSMSDVDSAHGHHQKPFGAVGTGSWKNGSIGTKCDSEGSGTTIETTQGEGRDKTLLQATGRGNSIKAAKTDAAREMLEMITKEFPEAMTQTKLQPKSPINTEVSMLNEFCVKNQLKTPAYRTNPAPDPSDHTRTIFVSCCSVSFLLN